MNSAETAGMDNAGLLSTTNSESPMDRSKPPLSDEATPKDATTRKPERQSDEVEVVEPKTEPPRTTTGPVTAPKFGSAGSGGAELEPPPKKP
jgi:hypothetical protein